MDNNIDTKINDKINIIKGSIIEKIDPDFIVLFGSQATGMTHSNSDIDIAFYKEDSKLSGFETYMMARNLENITGVEKVDLINLKEASTVFKAIIFSSGKILYCKNEYILDNYRMITFSMYARFNEERNVVLNAIYERGYVYGE